MRKSYWSCTKFADFIRASKKIPYGSAEEWHKWHAMAKQKSFRYWLAEEGLDLLQDIVYWPKDFLLSAHHYVHNRWISKTHGLNSSLKKGQYHEFDTRILFCLFDELINFVEIEKAHLYNICASKPIKSHSSRNPEAGIAHLEWEIRLVNDLGELTDQAFAAKETLALYQWWKNIRPHRPCPYEASGFNLYCENNSRSDNCAIEFNNESELRRLHNLVIQLEDAQDAEDTEMLIRLVKLRHRLWT